MSGTPSCSSSKWGKARSVGKLPVPITEAYNGYCPPAYVREAVEKLLRTVPPKYLVKLQSVVLTSRAGQPRRELRRRFSHGKRRIPGNRVLGFYSPASRRRRPHIEIYVDKLLDKSKWYSQLPLIREIEFGHVLFHELGHHVHYTLPPEYRDKEAVANEWGQNFLGNFARRKYWYLLPVLVPLARLVTAVGSRNKSRRRSR